MNKRLVLNRDVLVDLTTDDLRRVPAGTLGGGNDQVLRVTTVHVECPSDPVTGCTIIHETRYASCAGCTVTCPTDICV